MQDTVDGTFTTGSLTGQVVSVTYGRSFDMMDREWIDLTYSDGRTRRISSSENGALLVRDPADPSDLG
jgi:hypothetical protein